MNHIAVEDFSKICRLCLSFGSLQPIFKIKDLEVLQSISSITVKKEDKLPEHVCDSCLRQLEDISTFINTCETNDEILRKIIIEYENSLAEQANSCDNGNESSDDQSVIKNGQDSNDSFCLFNIKQEFIVEPEFDEKNNVEQSVSCENCSANFPSSESLKEHYNEIVLCRPRGYTKASVQSAKEKKDKSEESETEFRGKPLKGKRRFLCCYCGKNYTRKNGLDRHILSHTGVKPFECKECGKRYITKDTLKTHILTHTGVKSHKCTICQKMFTQSSHLSYHMRRHSGEKPFSCTCGKKFLSNYHLERHKLMHTGVKPFECKQCGKKFVRGTTLRDHMLIHSGEKPFQCQHCGKQFNRKQSLTNHVLVHTGHVRQSSGGAGVIRLQTSEHVDQNNSQNDPGINGTINSGPLGLHSNSAGVPGLGMGPENIVGANNNGSWGYFGNGR